MKRASPLWSLIILLALIKFMLPFLLQSPVYELQRDEYLYYEQGQHFDIGYLENPPLLSWLGTISSWFGGSIFWIKFWPSLFGALTLIFTCLIAAEFGGKTFAQLIAGMGILTGAFLRVHSLYQPNILDIFFWVVSAFCIIRFINSGRTKWIYLLFVSLALGFWSKFSVVFIGAGLLLSLLMSRYRFLFIEKKFYFAALVAAALVLPNVWWQYSHNWPLVHHMEELQETQLRFLNPGDFIKDQLLFLLPVIFVWIAGLVWLARNNQWRFLSYAYVLVIILLILGRGKSYYSLGIYPVLLAAGAASLESWSVKRSWARYALVTVILVLTIPLTPLSLPLWPPTKLAAFYQEYGIDKTGLLKWEDQRDHPLPQDFADMLGWKELAEKAETVYNIGLADSTRVNTVIYCRNYGQAGALKFYGVDPQFTSRVFTDNGSFLLWIPDTLTFRHLLFIGRDLPDKDDEVFNHFEQRVVMDSVTNPLSRQFGDKIVLFRNAEEKAIELARTGLNELKNRFRR